MRYELAFFKSDRLLGNVSRDEAHLYGLFHNCGLPMMMLRFSNYKETLVLANKEMERTFTDIEDERHGTNHAVVGAILAANWLLPEAMRSAIRHHHDLIAFKSRLSSETLNLISIGHMAQLVESQYARLGNDAEWDKLGDQVLAHLMLDDEQLQVLVNDGVELLAELGL